jgi:hypothetical protein
VGPVGRPQYTAGGDGLHIYGVAAWVPVGPPHYTAGGSGLNIYGVAAYLSKKKYQMPNMDSAAV